LVLERDGGKRGIVGRSSIGAKVGQLGRVKGEIIGGE
jgi:hypothetical protein